MNLQKKDKNQLKESNAQNSSLNILTSMIGHLPMQHGYDSMLASPYRSQRSNRQSQNQSGINLVERILEGNDENSALNFINTFIYGVEMEMWRKQRVKNVMVFVDSNLPVLVWFSSPTKSFLFDMTFTDIDLCEYQLQKASGAKYYFILRYFQQEIPLLFNDSPTMQKYYSLFNNYIKYNRLRQYPPFLSRIMKLYTMEEVKANISRKKDANDILNVTRAVFEVFPQDSEDILEKVYLQSRKQIMTLESELKTSEIRDYFSILHCSQDLIKIFQRYSKQRLLSKLQYLEKPMNKRQFIEFLINQQKETHRKAEQLAQNIRETINFYQFCTFLQNQKINHAAEAIQIDQNLPLTDYFCYSSHNTYLSGNQLTSDSKIERYLEDFQRGLKCVEIDIHNDGDRPIINHALKDQSFCAPIDFEETIKEIAKFCDNSRDHYPIIISIQNHSKEQNRYKVGNILLKYLMKRIFFINEAYEFEHPTVFKTLRELRGKVIIKTDSKLTEVISFKKKAIFSMKSQYLKLPSPQPNFPRRSFQDKYNRFQQTMKIMIKRKEDFDIGMPNTLFLPISEMAKVTGIFKSEKGIENATSVGCECTSLTNQKSIKCQEDKLIEYTKRSFLRIYPVGTEISSSNYDPTHHLKIGAQIIALNTQTKDDFAWMLMSYFKAGRTTSSEYIGYIPKPIYLRTNKKRENYKKIIKIEIVSKHKSVKVEFFGTKRDMKINAKAKQNVFETLDYDQSFLMFKIGDNLKECIPIRFIREGYRVLVAKNSLFKDLGIRVIVHISIKIQEISGQQ